MDGLELGMAAALLLGIAAIRPGVERPGAAAQVATRPAVGKVDLEVARRPSLRVSGLPENGESMLSGEWARR